MKTWEELKQEVHTVTVDKEMAKSLLAMMEIRARAVESLDKAQFASIIVEGYYEIIKEGMTALMALDGYKTLSHEALVAYLMEFYKDFSEHEIRFTDQLRKMRNKIVYQGFFVQGDYLGRNEATIKTVVTKLRKIIKQKL
ncbi:MAG: hypothetical protein HYY37_02635 [Candidatus Aenigmarchaeota archaeon]|nr:hypothetical protein [Candidatus Aenigmarchaeota archaeon]